MTECNVVRDLMPLVIDGAASAESAKIVAEHVAECEPCAKVYEELKGEIHESDRTGEQIEFEKTAWRIRTRRRLLAALLVLIVAITSAGTAWSAAPRYTEGVLPIKDISVQLLRLPDTDTVLLLIQPRDEHQAVSFNISYIWENEKLNHLLTVTDPTNQTSVPFYRYLLDIYAIRDGALVNNIGGSLGEVIGQFSWTDGSEETVLYRSGDEIPWASDELVQYMKVKQLCDNANGIAASYKRHAELLTDLERLEALVPEFQTK